MKRAPSGKPPKRRSGKASIPPGDREAGDRAADAAKAFKSIWIDHPPQTRIVDELRRYVRECEGYGGRPLIGCRLSEHSQAGKSATMAKLKAVLTEERIALGLEPNEHQVTIIELDSQTSLKGAWQEVLQALGDEYWDENVSAKVLERRIAKWVKDLGVDLLVIDEVQHLDRKTTDAKLVTDRLKVFLNRGIVPLVLVGDEMAEGFFTSNPKLRARLPRALELKPLDVTNEHKKADIRMFKRFCTELDEAVHALGFLDEKAGLDTNAMLSALAEVSRGHVGRVARIVQAAFPEAVGRGADRIEAYDLSNVVRSYAIGNSWVSRDPFLGWDDRASREKAS